MEAHILANLVQSIQHVIMIGDPLQLRPTLNNYSTLSEDFTLNLLIRAAELSMDSHRGSLLYRFDMSIMERLSNSGFPMSRIDIQRRMRPAISQLIRYFSLL